MPTEGSRVDRPRRQCVPQGLHRRAEEVEDGTVDLAFADPPFNIGYEYDVYDDRLGERAVPGTGAAQWTAEVVRVLKPNGTFWLAIGDEYAAELKVMLQQEHGLTCRSWVVWYYTFGVNCKYKFSRSHAHLFHMVKDPKQFTFNADADPRAVGPAVGLRRPPGESQGPAARRHLDPRGPQDSARRLSAGRRHVVFSPRVRHVQGAGRLARLPDAGATLGPDHPGVQQRGRLVLDPFGGSGTTLAVAKKLGRRFLGFELSAEYAKQIQQAARPHQARRPAGRRPDPRTSVPTHIRRPQARGETRRRDEPNGAEGTK